MGVLANPVAGGSGHFLSPWTDSQSFLSVLSDSATSSVRRSVQDSLLRFFGLNLVVLLGLIFWHISTPESDQEDQQGRAWGRYVLGWVGYFIVTVAGILLTCNEIPAKEWSRTYVSLWVLAVLSLIGAAVFVLMEIRTAQTGAKQGSDLPPEGRGQGHAG